MELELSKPMLDAYKTIGCFAHGPMASSATQPFSLAAACHNSFKIYSDELAIKMVSPCFSGLIRALHIHNQFTYVIVGTEIIKIRYYHIVSKWQLPHQSKIQKLKNQIQYAHILVFDGLIIVSIGTNLYLVPQGLQKGIQSGNADIQVMNLGINIIQIVHPVTYINKIIAYSHDKILLVNPISQKILFDYSTIVKSIIQGNKKISIICPSPLIDIVAVCLDSGEITILNIRTSKIIFTMKQKKAVTAISFSNTDSLMVSGDEVGNILLWDLENKNIVYRLQSAFPHAVNYLQFVPGISLIVAASSKSNSVKQFRINLDDNKTLVKFRQRTGCAPIHPILGVKCHNNKEITFWTQTETLFSSLYSHCNVYSLPYCLDSTLPYHLVSKHFSVQIYRERTVIGKINIHESALVGTFSISKKFVIVGTKSRVLKIAIPGGANPSTSLLISCEWNVKDPRSILPCKEHSLYVICFETIYVFSFNESKLIATINEGDNCYNAVANESETMLAIQNRTKDTIQIWDMRNISISRQFVKPKSVQCTKLCFSSDNKYLLSAQIDKTVMIWSILQSNLYKMVNLEQKIIDMKFTPDNAYLLTVFQGAREINIWHNYIGKVVSSQSQSQTYHFVTPLNYLSKDYRQKLNAHKHLYELETGVQDFTELDSLLDQIEDAPDVQYFNYDFGNVSKWMPLVYYDEIKNRNSINKSDQVPSLPFFLDFKNLSQQQQKINRQLKQQLKDKKNKQQQKIDEQLSNDSHEIRLDQNSTEEDYERIWNTLSKLSIAEVDYQLRKYLMTPGKLPYLLAMVTYLVAQRKFNNLLLLNVLLVRILNLAGTELCAQECKQQGGALLKQIEELLSNQETIVQKCVAIATHNS